MRSLLPSVALLAGAVLVISGCQEPISPELTPTEGPLLHTAPAALSAVLDSRAGIANPAECITPLEDGTLVFKGCVFPQILTGDLEGDGTALFDGKIDAAGNGGAHGTLFYTLCVAPGVCGDFEGPFHGKFIAGQFNGPLRLRGMKGGVRGILIRATFTEQGTPSTGLWDLDGAIHFPT